MQAGDRCPDFLLPPDDGMSESFHARYAGRPLALLLAHEAGDLAPYAALAHAVPVLALLASPAAPGETVAVPAVYTGPRLTGVLGLRPGGPVVWVLDATLHLRQRFDAPPPETVMEALRRLAASDAPARWVREPTAPVLIVPDVLEPALCARLIQAHAADHTPSGMLRLRDGQPVLEIDARVKQRFDHRLTKPALVEAVTTALARRVLPEIAAAFHYEVSQLEGFKVTAYDAAQGGWFRPHRDNVTPDARHRRFALTIALDDDFDGGGLRFPGFGPTLYRPRPGAAIVFSGALLHEVTDVTRGRRHVLLSFLWGDEVQPRPGAEGR
jgi:predicted 2-oxoglutarate/Fe(II)-dependent dioxygenase YbiX